MHIGHTLARVSTLALLATTAIAGNVHVVAPTGAPYTDIQAAVDAAQDGDIVLVKPGTYPSFVVRNIELSIVADAGPTVFIDGAIRVGPNHATRTLLLQGLTSRGVETGSPFTRNGLYAHDVAGLLLANRCIFIGKNASDGSCTVGSGAVLERCAKVCFVETTANGGGGMNDNWGPPGKGVRAHLSSVALYSCELNGGVGGNDFTPCGLPPGPYVYGDGTPGGIGLQSEQSFTYVAFTTIRGGRGGNGWVGSPPVVCTAGGAGGAGIETLSAPAVERRGGLLAGGSWGTPAPVFGCNSHGPNGALFLGLAPNYVDIPRRSASFEVPRREQQASGVGIHGVPGEQVQALELDATAFAWHPTLDSVRFFSTRHPQPIAQLGTVGANQNLSVVGTIGELGPGVQGARSVMQLIFVSSAGGSFFGPLLPLIRLDSSF